MAGEASVYLERGAGPYHGEGHSVDFVFVFGLVLSEGTVPGERGKERERQERERERERARESERGRIPRPQKREMERERKRSLLPQQEGRKGRPM